MITAGNQDWFDPAYMPQLPEDLFFLPKEQAQQYICRAPVSLQVKARLLRKLGAQALAQEAQAAYDSLTGDTQGFLCVVNEMRTEDSQPFSVFLGVFDSYQDFCDVPDHEDTSQWFTLYHYVQENGKHQLLEIYDWYKGNPCWFVGAAPHPFAPVTIEERKNL